jgi:hypothetical protein
MTNRLAEDAPSGLLLTPETGGLCSFSLLSLTEADSGRSVLSTHVYD